MNVQPPSVLSNNGAKKRGRRSRNHSTSRRHHNQDDDHSTGSGNSSAGSHASDSSYSSSSDSDSLAGSRRRGKKGGQNKKNAGGSGQQQQQQRRQRNNGGRRQNNNTSRAGRGRKGREQPAVVSQEEKDMYVALDAEMVGVGVDGLDSEIARVAIVDWDGRVLMDTYVRPTRPVTDYRTFVSGITAEDLDGASVIDIDECRGRVLEILDGRVLVGHALKNDLTALGIRHPWSMTRDTAKYEPFMKVREYDGRVCPCKLKDLALHLLNRDVQLPGQPHSPVEDAVTAMELYKFARKKFEAVMEYKINKTRQIEMMQQQQEQQIAAEPVGPSSSSVSCAAVAA